MEVRGRQNPVRISSKVDITRDEAKKGDIAS